MSTWTVTGWAGWVVPLEGFCLAIIGGLNFYDDVTLAQAGTFSPDA